MALLCKLLNSLFRTHFAKASNFNNSRKIAWEAFCSLDGHYSAVLRALCCSKFLEISQKTVLDSSISRYSKPWPERLLTSDLEAISSEREPIALLAYAMYQEGIYVEIPDDVEISCKVTLGSSTRWHMDVGKNAVVHLKIANQPSSPSNSLYSFDINRGGFVSVTKAFEPGLVDCFAERVFLNDEASYQQTGIFSTRYARNDLRAVLHGKGSSIHMKSLAVAPALTHVENSIWIDQKGEDTRSFVLHKAVVSDGACSQFHSLGRLQAQHSVSHSYVHHLTLGSNACIQAQPMFEIFHDDVEASHGCTAKSIDKDFMVYAASRGVEPKMAAQLFVEGFCAEILKNAGFGCHCVSSVLGFLAEA